LKVVLLFKFKWNSSCGIVYVRFQLFMYFITIYYTLYVQIQLMFHSYFMLCSSKHCPFVYSVRNNEKINIETLLLYTF